MTEHCRDCQHPVEEQAVVCPNCGARNPELSDKAFLQSEREPWGFFGGFLLIGVLIMWYFSRKYGFSIGSEVYFALVTTAIIPLTRNYKILVD